MGVFGEAYRENGFLFEIDYSYDELCKNGFIFYHGEWGAYWNDPP